ncbi:hypothetical protein [Thioalkalivibrio sp. AKL12]|uniref:hypothetical protein n=1 Tax=Thioalkalivibrio sp. AKL12 TaxID=1158159 RepID=UPI00035CDD3D|nr:hypothetical protein [Thioalkalivibrio sp. AKL12]
MKDEPKVSRSSQPYSDFGDLSGTGARRLLGTPATEPLETAIRESGQNSWDARLPGEVPEYLVRLRTLTEGETRYLREVVFEDLSPDPKAPLEKLFRNPLIRVAEICDFRTHGLTGTARPSELTASRDSRFVRFLRNIGSPRRDGSESGGTYGYGKSSLFALSSCQTVVVDSLTSDEDGPSERRFMASRMGEEFHDPETGRGFTGRHWWGAESEDGSVVDPVRGEDARRLAESLGLPERDEQNKTGTSVLILDPVVGIEPDDHPTLASYIHRALLWLFWPKMVPKEGSDRPPMRFRVELGSHEFPVPNVEQNPPFHLFAQALQKARSGSSERAEPIVWGKSRKLLGHMGHEIGYIEDRPVHLQGKDGLGMPHVSHHVALLRPAELVVKYLEGPIHPKESLEWAGVFISSREQDVEEAFAAAEPPTHDDWNVQSLPKKSRARSFVRVALSRIGDKTKEFVPDPRAPTGEGSEGLAGIADRLGSSLLSGDGDRAVRRNKPGKSGGGTRAPVRLTGVSPGQLESEGHRTIATFHFTVVGSAGTPVEITARPTIAADGSESIDVSPDGDRPQLREWKLDGEDVGTTDTVLTDMKSGRMEGSVRVTVPAGVAVKPRISVREASTDA